VAFSRDADAFQPKHQMWMSATADFLVDDNFARSEAETSETEVTTTPATDVYAIRNNELPVDVFRIQAWLAEKRQQSEFWTNSSLVSGGAGLLLLASPRYLPIPYWMWLLAGPLALAAVSAGHYARFLSRRAQSAHHPINAVGLVLGYVVAISFAVVLGILQSDL